LPESPSGLPARQPSVAEKSHLTGKATTFFSNLRTSKCGDSQSEAEAKGVAFVKEKGTVKWFNGAKGYGFIQRSTGEDVFVHFSAIQENGYRTLNEGETVEYELMKGPKGFLAANVLRGSAN
jgi:cold shock protein